MQPPQHGKRRFTVQLTNIPIIAFKDELTGKEDAARKFTVDLLGKVRDSSIGSVPKARYALAAKL
jgi:hypothetical protein